LFFNCYCYLKTVEVSYICASVRDSGRQDVVCCKLFSDRLLDRSRSSLANLHRFVLARSAVCNVENSRTWTT